MTAPALCFPARAPEMGSAAILEPQPSTGAGGGSPIASPGMVDRSSKRQEWGPDAAKSWTTSLFGKVS